MESQDKVERVPVGHVGCEDLLGFVSALLEEVNQLLKHDDSTERDLHKGGGWPWWGKLQVHATGWKRQDAKLKNNPFLLAVVDAKDSHKNIQRVLRPYKKLDLSKMM